LASIDLNRVKEVFAEAIALPLSERSAYLDEACGGDAPLRVEVDAYLSAAEKTQGMMRDSNDSVRLSERPGAIIGRYKLLEQIGEGGFGVVFMAEQEQPVRRRVALKIIKLGMDTKQVIARFEAERQALAMMDHPSVARVFDGGATEAGRPYFVMELVKGIPITEYCDANKLSIRQRLELFAQVCQAVQHAHQKGLIHRDIKPSNVLVATQDDRPIVKVIDFGIAKAMQARLTEKTLFTEFKQLIGTPEYMSPEQAGGGLDIDTRSDVYSLGVLLYELLAGAPPFHPKELRSKAFAEMQRIIREVEPPTPSTRLSALASLPSIAAHRGTEPKKLSHAIRGELDWIVMRCLEKDRRRRYESAAALAQDIQHYLLDQPVTARPATRRYRMKKFFRRHKAGVLAGAALVTMLLLLVVALTVSNVLIARERNQKSAALSEAQAQRQRAERNLLKARTAVAAILTRPAAGVGDWSQLTPALRKTFSDEAIRYYQSLLAEGSRDPSLRYETAVGYRSLALLHYRAGEYQQSEQLQRHSIDILSLLTNASPNDFEYRHQLAYSHMALADTLVATTRPAEADTTLQTSVEVYEKLRTLRPDDPDYSVELARCYARWVNVPRDEKPRAEAERVYQHVLDALATLPDTIEAANLRTGLGLMLVKVNRLADAHRILREAIEMYDRHAGQGEAWELTDAFDTLRKALSRLADTNKAQGNLAEAQVAHRDLERAYAQALQQQPNSAELHMHLGDWLFSHDRFAEAADAYSEAIRFKPDDEPAWLMRGRAYMNSGHPEKALPDQTRAIELNPRDQWAWHNRGWCYKAMREFAKAIPDYSKAIELGPGISRLWFDRGDCWTSLGQSEKAADDFTKAIALAEKELALKPNDADSYNALAWTLATLSQAKLRDPRRAVELAEKGVQLAPANGGIWNTLGIARYRAGDLKPAISDLEKSMQLSSGGSSFDYFFLAMANWQLGDRAAAQAWYDKGMRWMQAKSPRNVELSRFRAEAAKLLGIAEPSPTSLPATRP